MSAPGDAARVRRASLRVGILVALSSAVILAVGVGTLVLVLLRSARPEHEADHRPSADGDRFVVDLDHVLPWVVGLGLLTMLLLGIVAWLAARSAVRPLADALGVQRTFVADASHELRTPLTALTSRIQILERRAARGDAIDPTLRELRRDAAVMDDVLTDMLLTAEGDQSPEAPSDVAGCASAALALLHPFAEERGVTLTSTVPPARAAVPTTTLTRLCVALLDNAVQHSRPGTEVSLTSHSTARTVEIRVADAGPGVAPAERERIFERFARGAETGQRRGFGLGLALVRESARRYGGAVSIEHTSDRGTVFLLRVPAALN